MARDAGLLDANPGHDLTHGAFAAPQAFDDRASGRIGQPLQKADVAFICIYMRMYVTIVNLVDRPALRQTGATMTGA